MARLEIRDNRTGEVVDSPRAPEPQPAEEAPGWIALNEARQFIARFWVPPSGAALDVMALWAAHCHVTDKDGQLASYSTPRLAFVSDQPGSGKTAALELLGLLCPRPVQVTDPTAPALLSLIAERRATILVDEVDLLFGAGQAAKAVRAVINSGYRRGACVARVKGPQDTFSPVALAGLASSYMGNATLAPTRERSIIVHCAKPGPGVKPERYREQLHGPLGALAGQSLAEWAAKHVVDISTAWPEMPEGLDGRQEDVWAPLFAVAEVAGGEWPAKCRAACLAFTRGRREETASALPPRLRLLQGIRAAWPQGAESLSLSVLADRLSAVPGEPWAAIWTPVQMTREIPATLGIAPVRVTSGGAQVQGLSLGQLSPMFAELPEEVSA